MQSTSPGSGTEDWAGFPPPARANRHLALAKRKVDAAADALAQQILSIDGHPVDPETLWDLARSLESALLNIKCATHWIGQAA